MVIWGPGNPEILTKDTRLLAGVRLRIAHVAAQSVEPCRQILGSSQ